jgi:mitogen-activated protein kinase kinase kinase
VDTAPVEWMKGSLIGRGTFGDVYLGLSPISGELMAVKQVELPVLNSATEDRKRAMISALEQEIALLRDLHHENIVQYLGFQCDEAHFSIFLEYVPGGSVAGLLASYGAFKEPLVCSFVRQILKGLNYLHGRDIIHRDIKGANVLGKGH